MLNVGSRHVKVQQYSRSGKVFGFSYLPVLVVHKSVNFVPKQNSKLAI